MINVGKKSKLQFHWKVSPYDYSEEKVKNIISKASKKYSIPKENIKVIPDFAILGKDGESLPITNDIISNIQDFNFQLELFKEFIKINKIENCDFDFIRKIDSEINASVTSECETKNRRYSIKWVKWNNFLSYGKDNFFDFSQLNGIVLLNGEPANQSGKTTFAIDLLHFLLYGKTSKAATQEKVFNKWLKEETEVTVEGCVEIDGVDYVIKRTLSRPQLSKRTSKSKTSQKVEYYKIVGGNAEELSDYVENQQEENSIQTNKVIKDTIGNESDFDLMICATSSNLDDLIEKKDTERGRILSRWIGLVPIEEKEEIAKEKFNTSIKPYLVSRTENTEKLLQEREAFFIQMKETYEYIEKCKKEQDKIAEDIAKTENNIKLLNSAKKQIDSSIPNLNETSISVKISELTKNGINKKTEIESLANEINSIDIKDYSEDVFTTLTEKQTEITSKLSVDRNEYKHLSKQISDLENGEYCPTCHRKLDNVDNSVRINELKTELERIKEDGLVLSKTLDEIKLKIAQINETREKFLYRSKLEIKKSSLEVQIEKLRSELLEERKKLEVFKQNEEAIKHNNNVDIELRNCEESLKNLRNTKEKNLLFVNNLENNIEVYKNNISEIEKLVEKIKEEEKLIFHWNLYLQMVGKNGISKMVLRQALPIINAQLKQILSDVCDFSVEIEMTDKNEVLFYLNKDGIKTDISSGSGFEKTASALALRFVLAKNSVMPKLDGIVLDEISGRVAQENLDNIKTIIERAQSDYKHIIMVSHNETMKEWASTIVTVQKDDNGISKLSVNKKRDN